MQFYSNKYQQNDSSNKIIKNFVQSRTKFPLLNVECEKVYKAYAFLTDLLKTNQLHFYSSKSASINSLCISKFDFRASERILEDSPLLKAFRNGDVFVSSIEDESPSFESLLLSQILYSNLKELTVRQTGEVVYRHPNFKVVTITKTNPLLADLSMKVPELAALPMAA